MSGEDEKAENVANGDRTSATASSRGSSSQAVAFGRQYFYAISGVRRTQLADENGSLVECYQWEEPPWQREDHEITQTVCSTQATIFLTSTGKVLQTGTMHGQIYKKPTLVTIPLPLKCVQVSAGRHFCLGRMEGGLAVVSWGTGHFGQLGIGSNDGEGQITFTPHPVVMERLLPHVIGSPIAQVAAGDWHGLALTESGRVWAWGSNRSQQCGRKPAHKGSSSQAPTIVIPLPVPMDVSATQISAGRSHSVAIANNQVYCWGSSMHGQCGNAVRRSGVSPPRLVEGLSDLTIKQIAAGGNHTMALTTGGRVFAWGSNAEGQLGLGPMYTAQPKPRLVADLDFVAVAAGQEWKLKQRDGQQNDEPLSSGSEQLSNIPRITAIFAGVSYSAALSSSGHVYSWGSNDVGQIGFPTPEKLPLKDNYIHSPPKTTSTRDLDVCTFDSSHNVLLPVRIDVLRHLNVRTVACGPNHMWCIGERRTEEQEQAEVGRTLYEVQEGHRRKSLQRARDSLLAKATMAAIVDSDDYEQDDDELAVLEENRVLGSKQDTATTTPVHSTIPSVPPTTPDSIPAHPAFLQGGTSASPAASADAGATQSTSNEFATPAVSPEPTSPVVDQDPTTPTSIDDVNEEVVTAKLVEESVAGAASLPKETKDPDIESSKKPKRAGVIRRLSLKLRRKPSGKPSLEEDQQQDEEEDTTKGRGRRRFMRNSM